MTLNNEGESDEEMGAVASYWPINEEWRGQIPQPATSHTPDGRRVQPESKKRRFSTVPTAPRHSRTRAHGAAGLRKAAGASLGDVPALFATAKEILEQGNAAEVAAVAGWKRIAEETEAHKQGTISMFDSITSIQTDFRNTIRREDALQNSLQIMGSAIERSANDATENVQTVTATVAGAATEIVWLKARMEAMERRTEQPVLRQRQLTELRGKRLPPWRQD